MLKINAGEILDRIAQALGVESDTDSLSQRAQAQLDAALLSARPVAPVLHLHTEDAGGGEDACLICDWESRQLKTLVRQIAAAQGIPETAVWSKANALGGVAHHRDLKRCAFGRVKTCLEQWLGNLEQVPR